MHINSHWVPPPPSWDKCIDASILESTSSVTITYVFRDCNGKKWLLDRRISSYFSGNDDYRYTIRSVRLLRNSRIIVTSDSQVTNKTIRGQSSAPTSQSSRRHPISI